MHRFHFSFQDPDYLYMCMDLVPGGELLGLITLKQDEKLELGIENQACDLSTTRFYIAEIVEAMEYLHKKNIIHRDLKPESKLERGVLFSPLLTNSRSLPVPGCILAYIYCKPTVRKLTILTCVFIL